MMKNTEICQKLRRLHTLLVLGKRSNNLALAIRRALEIIPTWKEEAEVLIKKSPIRLIFAGYGPKFIKIFEELMKTGKIEMVEKLQPEFDPFFCDLCEIPSIGETMARRMFFERSIRTMDDLRIAYSNDILVKIPAFGENRLKAIEALLLDKPQTVEPPKPLDQHSLKTIVNMPLSNISEEKLNSTEVLLDENLSSEVGNYIEDNHALDACRQTQIHSPILYKTVYARPPKIVDKSTGLATIVQTRGVVSSIQGYCHDFKTLREQNSYYVDKTHLISDLIEKGHTITQYQRPHGFGLSISLSMFKAFFEQAFDPSKDKIDHHNLFDNLRISKADPQILSEMNRYPVVYLVFEENCEDAIRQVIAEQYQQYRWLLNTSELEGYEKTKFTEYLSGADNTDITLSIRLLTQWIYRITNVQVVCLIDIPADIKNKTDNPFVRIVDSACTENPALSRCIVMTHQILPFHHAQTISVHSKTRDEYFGFNELEVRSLLRYFHLESCYETLLEWYGNMDISGRDIFMPEGVMQSVQSLQMSGNTVKNEHIWNLLQGKPLSLPFSPSICQDISTLCYHRDRNDTITREIQGLYQTDLGYSSWMDMGLIRATEQLPTTYGTLKCKFKIPNESVRFMLIQWLWNIRRQQILSDKERLTSFKEALELGPSNALEFELKKLFSKLPTVYEPELRFYRQIMAEICECAGFQFVIQAEQDAEPELLIVDSDKAICLFIKVLSADELKQNQLSMMLEPDPTITPNDLKKLTDLLDQKAHDQVACIDKTMLESQIILKYPEVNTILYYHLSICRNQCKIVSDK